MRRIARSGCEPGTRPSSSAYENSNPDLSSIPRIIPIRLASTRGNHASETKERTFFNILLIEARNYPRRPGPVSIVLGAELCAQQPLFRADAREERRNDQRRDQQADSRPK